MSTDKTQDIIHKLLEVGKDRTSFQALLEKYKMSSDVQQSVLGPLDLIIVTLESLLEKGQ